MSVTFNDIAKKTIEIINEKPDFNYQDFRRKQTGKPADCRWSEVPCVYFDGDNEPSCLFGHVFAALELPYNRSWEDTNIVDVIKDFVHIELEMHERNWLFTLQNWQDRGHTWGSALESANELYPQVTASL